MSPHEVVRVADEFGSVVKVADDRGQIIGGPDDPPKEMST